MSESQHFVGLIGLESPFEQIRRHRQMMIAMGRYLEYAFCFGVNAVQPHETGNTIFPAQDAFFSQLFRNAGAAISPAAHFIGFFDLFEKAFVLIVA